MNDQKYMQRALELARKGEGLTRPNPPVGAILVLNEEVLAEGFHAKAGELHAERDCLANYRARGRADDLSAATLYVTLEPCSTTGRTPPCTDAILEVGIGRVVCATADLNPAHAGRGFEILKAAGISVEVGVCEAEALRLLAPFHKRITTGLPWVRLKLAMTLDGCIADRTGASKWITGAEARERVQQMRREADAIMVGSETVIADDPSLLPRPDLGRKPFRVVMDSRGRVTRAAKIFQESPEQTLIYETRELETTLCDLAERGVMSVLCEGGGELAGALIEAGLVDEFSFFYAPKILGGDAKRGVAGAGRLMDSLHQLTILSSEQLGVDLLVTAQPVK